MRNKSEAVANRDWALSIRNDQVQPAKPVVARRPRPTARPPYTVGDLYNDIRKPLAVVLCIVAVILWVSL